MRVIIWDYYDKIPGKTEAKCKLCDNEYSYKTSVTNLKKHLRHKHLFAYQNISNSYQPKQKRPTTPTSPKMKGTLSAIVWNHYEKIPGTTEATCKLCKKDYSYKTSITNLKKHLRYKHISAYQNSLNTNANNLILEIKSENQRTSESDAEQEENGSISSDPLELSHLETEYPENLKSENVPPCASGQLKKTAKTVYMPPKIDQTDKKFIDKKVLDMIIQDYQPFSIVEDTGFQNFVKALNPNYELPNRKLISGTLIPDRYLECKDQIMELVQNAKTVCLTTECWTSVAKNSYFAVTAHFLIDFESKSVLLHCEPLSTSHTAEALAVTLKDIASQWNITNKITLAVSDNTENLKRAIQKTGWPYFGCFLDKLNLIIEKAIRTIDSILQKVKIIVDHFKNNNLATKALVKYQIDIDKNTEPLRLIQSVPTRWNSIFYMLERFLKLRGALDAVIKNLKTDFTVEMWEAIKQVCMILKPFEEITHIMNGSHYLTASLAIVIVDGLKNVINVMKTKPIQGVAKNFLAKLEEGLNKHFPVNEIEDNMLLGVCTFLDPRFKIHAFLDNAAVEVGASEETYVRTARAYLIKEHVLELLKTKLSGKCKNPAVEIVLSAPQTSTSVDDIETISIWGKFDKTIAAITPSVDDVAIKAKNELEMFLNEDMVQRHSCPLTWWQYHACIYPNLAEIFNEHCHNVVTSVECERVFSKEGNFIAEKRSILSRKHTTKLVFLKTNKPYCN